MADNSGFGNPELDAILAGAKGALNRANATEQVINQGVQHTPDVSAFRDAHPGQFDHISDSDIQTEINKQRVNSSVAAGRPTVVNGHIQVNPVKDLEDFLGSAVKASPLNPVNLYQMARHPIDTVGNIASIPYNVVKDVANTVTGGDPQGRIAAAAKAPLDLVGTPSSDIVSKFQEGDIPGAYGALAGAASPLILPELAGAAGKVADVTGRGIGKAGDFLTSKAKTPLGVTAAYEAVSGHPLTAAATIIPPYLMKYGGPLLSKFGNALSGLSNTLGAARSKLFNNVGTPAEAPVGPEYPESWKPFINRENTSPTAGSTGWTTKSGFRSPISSEIAMEPEGGWGESAATPTRPTTFSSYTGMSGADYPSMQGLSGAADRYATTAAVRNPETMGSYNRPSVPYSEEAVQWLQQHTPEPVGGWKAWNEAELYGKDRTTGSAEGLADVANRARLARQGLLASQ